MHIKCRKVAECLVLSGDRASFRAIDGLFDERAFYVRVRGQLNNVQAQELRVKRGTVFIWFSRGKEIQNSLQLGDN